MSANRPLQVEASRNGQVAGHTPGPATSPSPDGKNGKAARASALGAGVRVPEKPAPSPSANRANGSPETSTAAADPAPSRDVHGRFAKGNPVGHGNPFARQVAALRQQMLDSLTPERLQAVCKALIEKAVSGDVAAIKLLFSYTIGKPGPAPDPDLLDEQEWLRFKAQAPMLKEAPRLLDAVLPEMALDLLRTARPAMTRERTRMMGQVLAMGAPAPSPLLDRMDSLSPDKLAAELAKMANSLPARAPSPKGGNGNAGAAGKNWK